MLMFHESKNDSSSVDDASIFTPSAFDDSHEVRHEVFFEKEFTSLHDRQLFVGRRLTRTRFLVALIILIIGIVVLAGRAVVMQIVQGKWYHVLAENNRLRHIPLWPLRGMISDKNGVVLAYNTSRLEVAFTPKDLPIQDDARESVLGESARLLGLSIRDFDLFLSATTTVWDEEVVLPIQLEYDQALAVVAKLPDLPGFHLRVGSKRNYPLSKAFQSFSHVLGYIGKLSSEEHSVYRSHGYQRNNEIGKQGIERTYESVLRGTPGERIYEVDSKGTLKDMVGDAAAVDGKELRLTLDNALQETAEHALRGELGITGTRRGVVIAMDPRNGGIFAIVSLPSYDNNLFIGFVSSTAYNSLIDDPDAPLFPRAWAGTYPSGSTVKIVISAAALAERIIDNHTSVVSQGGIRVGKWFFPDWKVGGHGVTDVRKAIAWSVNTFYYMIGGGYESFVGLGVDRLTNWFKRFGLANKSGIDLPAEAVGFVPSKEWKEQTKGERWFIGDTYNLSIGQGDLLVTPIQVARYTAAIANGGTLVIPHVVQSIGGVEQTFPLSKIDGLDLNSVRTVQLGMRDNIVFGSGRALGGLGVRVAGKTGTAQGHADKKTHAWFTSYAPFDSPEIVVTVLLEESGEGSEFAVPVAKHVIEEWAKLKRERGGVF